MVVSVGYGRESDIVRDLREFETVLSKMEWKMISPVEYKIASRLNHLFTKYIDVNTITDNEVGEFLKIIHTYKIGNQVKNMIMARLLFDLDELNTCRSERLRVNILENRILNRTR